MKHAIPTLIILAIIIGAGFYVGKFYQENLSGIGPIIKSPPFDITKEINENSDDTEVDSGPLTLPEGFSIEVFAKDLPGARVIAPDRIGNLWVSQTKEGQISLLRISDGKIGVHAPVWTDLNKPHGLAFDPLESDMLYVAEEDKISRVDIGCLLSETKSCAVGDFTKIIDLPAGGRHTTRTIEFGPHDNRLYVSIGSSCDVCAEEDPRRGAIYSINKDGSDFKPFAKGLRNSVFFVWRPDLTDIINSPAPGIWEAPKMWATEMGRDMLGDNLPPDEINIIEEDKNYGWPTCYGANVHDTEFDKNTYIRNPCLEPFETGSFINIPAHSAPLGLAAIPPNSNWPEDIWDTLLVAYHGSWNRSEPTGYKVVQWLARPGDENLQLREPTAFRDFVSGWLTDEGILGRPVDLKFQERPLGFDLETHEYDREKGVYDLYISDDRVGAVYRVMYVGE